MIVVSIGTYTLLCVAVGIFFGALAVMAFFLGYKGLNND